MDIFLGFWSALYPPAVLSLGLIAESILDKLCHWKHSARCPWLEIGSICGISNVSIDDITGTWLLVEALDWL